MDKWLTLPDMGHILATHYNKVVVELSEPGERISETFFSLRGKPLSNPEKKSCLPWICSCPFLSSEVEGRLSNTTNLS
jgi:hypothetical protein